MTKTQHKRTAVASMFENGISRNTKCAKRDGFRREGHICEIVSRAEHANTLMILECLYKLSEDTNKLNIFFSSNNIISVELINRLQ